MPFQSDNQRKAVMAKLNQGYVRSDVKPKVINAMPSTDNLIGLKNKAGFEIDERYSQLIKKRLSKKEQEEFKQIFKNKPFAPFRALQDVEFNRKDRLGNVSISEVRRQNKAIGHHFFDKESVRFFNSRIETKGNLIKNKYFITSEQFVSSTGEKAPRKYTIRENNNGKIDTVGKFNEITSLTEAKKIARKL